MVAPFTLQGQGKSEASPGVGGGEQKLVLILTHIEIRSWV